MGGTTEPITTALKDSYTENADLTDAVRTAVAALRAGSANGSGGDQPALGVSNLEVAILDAGRPRRAFRRFSGAPLEPFVDKANPTGSQAPTRSKDTQDPQTE